MPMTPRDIHEKEFHEQWRGYNQEEVDDFLDRVSESLDELQRENLAMVTRLRELDQAVATSRETEEMLKKTLVTAQQAAETAIATAKEKAEKLITEAEERVHKVNAEVEERVTQAQAEVTQKAADAQRKYDLRRRELDTTIERLTAYESELKQKLKTFLEQQKVYLDQQISSLEGLATNGSAPVVTTAPQTAVPRDTTDRPDRLHATPSMRTPMPHADEPAPEAGDEESPSIDDSDEPEPARRGVRGLFWRDES
jgi:cell division initiation protein